MVKVWYDPIRDLGTSVYPTYGFIYQNRQALQLAQTDPRYWSAQGGLAKSAANQVAASVRASPLDIITQAADSTDRIAALIAAASGGQSEDDKPAAPR